MRYVALLVLCACGRIGDYTPPADASSAGGRKVFQAGYCTVWAFTDSGTVHYLAEGRPPYSQFPIACSVR